MERPQNLEALLALLADPSSYPDDPTHVEVVQTHISIVGISASWVLKVKKAVELGFLDFSTRKKRRHFCEEEVRLNRRLCAETYEGVLPILEDACTRSGLRVGTAGELDGPGVVDHAVLMRRLADGGFMHQRIRDGLLSEDDLSRVVKKLADFYRTHPATPASSAWGDVDRIRVSVDENFEQMRQHVGTLIAPEVFDVLRTEASGFMERHAELFAQRTAEGWIRDCHGDLHLDHVHISKDQVCIYDCIEFNDRFRYVDVASDVAFVAMDLDHSGRPDLAARMVSMLAAELEDPGLLRVLTFYKTYRAIVRAKVAAMKSLEEEVPSEERARAGDEVRSYLKLALAYVTTGDRPTVVIVMGRVATGKSTQAQMLGESCGWTVLSSDVTRKRLAGLPVYERPDDKAREELYSASSSENTYAALLRRATAEITAGHSVIVDATFSRRSDRERFMAGLHETHTPAGEPANLRFIEVTAPPDLVRGRLLEREDAEGLATDARLSDLAAINEAYEPLDPTEGLSRLAVASEQGPSQTHGEILVWLARASRR